jgi:hypothetical protein
MKMPRWPKKNDRPQQGIGLRGTEAIPARRIPNHVGEPAEPPPITPARRPPAWEMLDRTVEFDPIHPEPEYEFEQSVSW